MNLKEACQFLDLPENASVEQLVFRYREKKTFFEMLHSNAPNAIIKNLQVNNLKKLDEIAAILPHKELTKVDKKEPNSNYQNKENKKSTEQNDFYSNEENKEVLALLVVHTENKPTTSFSLYDGENSIGRNEHPSLKSILIKDDNYVSRFHCTLIVKNNYGELSAAIADDGRNNNGKPSLNGCYYNGEPERIKMKKLNEGDTIQIGMTKLVFKWKMNSAKLIEEEVEESEFMGTIVINI